MKLVRPITICLTDTYKDYDSQDTSAEVGLGTNTKKIKYMFISHQHNAWQNHNINKANKSFQKWQSLNTCKKGCKLKLDSWISWQQFKFRDCISPISSQTFVFPYAIYECKYQNSQNHNFNNDFTQNPFTLKEKCTLSVSEDRTLNRILGNRQGSGKGKKEEDDREHFTTLYQTFLRHSNREGQDR